MGRGPSDRNRETPQEAKYPPILRQGREGLTPRLRLQRQHEATAIGLDYLGRALAALDSAPENGSKAQVLNPIYETTTRSTSPAPIRRSSGKRCRRPCVQGLEPLPLPDALSNQGHKDIVHVHPTDPRSNSASSGTKLETASSMSSTFNSRSRLRLLRVDLACCVCQLPTLAALYSNPSILPCNLCLANFPVNQEFTLPKPRPCHSEGAKATRRISSFTGMLCPSKR